MEGVVEAQVQDLQYGARGVDLPFHARMKNHHCLVLHLEHHAHVMPRIYDF